ncbi:MAG: AMP-dependent synthetase/ligase [Thermoplasmatota archaeon]
MAGGQTTVTKVFWDSVEKNRDTTAQTWFEDDAWHSRTYGDFGDAVAGLALGLLAAGVKKGDRVSVWSKNSPRWAEVDMADQTIGACTVPIYDTLTGGQGAYILNNSDAKVLFVEDKEMLDRVWAVKDQIKSVKTFVVLDDTPVRRAGCTTYKAFVKKGADFAKKNPDALEKAKKSVKPSDLASFVYTSGTTGDPKGVMLSQWNLASNALVAQTCVDIGPSDKFLSFLPLSHVFERTGGHFTAYGAGAQVVFARGIETLTDDMKTHSPTIMMSVPRLYEKIYAKIMAGVEGGSFLKRFIFNWAIAQGKAANVYRQRNEPLPRSLQGKVNRAHNLVFKKLHAAVGGNLRYFVSGGAALNKEIEEFFWAAGIEILVGYGLTETSPVTNVNRPGAVRFGSVGKAVPGAEIKIDTSEWVSSREDVAEGEICIKGDMVMQGYFKNKKATDEVMDKDGFFHTGDVGYLDDDGFLFITDRKKEIIVMSNGKNVAPQPIEGLLKLQPHIEQACLIGDDRKYMACLIQPDFEALEDFARANGIAATGDQLVADQRVVSLFEKEVEAVNAQLSRYEQIKKFWLMPAPWGVDSGELTPTLKLKRRIIADKFQSVIDSLYPSN